MLVLFETPAGYSLFTVRDEERLSKTDPDEIHEEFFANEEKAKSSLRLVSFQPFSDTADAVSAATACMEGSLTSSLRSFLKKQIPSTGGSSKKKKKAASSSSSESLVVADKGLAATIKQKLPSLPCTVVHDSVRTNELFRGIRSHVDHLLQSEDGGGGGVSGSDLKAMQLGLSHSLGRYKLKFSADKVDTMVIQAIGLLDELDKEINTYAMRVKEWYGWHFPEMQGIIGDNAQYSKIVTLCGFRSNFRQFDLSHVVEEESVEAALKEAAEVSMGTEISDMDIVHIRSLAEQVLSMTEYRAQLYEYLKNRMNAIAPNLTVLVGEIVGARLVSHAGSLMNLAKQPASTVQILGAEKALFRALKTKHDTPKYGLIYHASLVGQAAPKHKGKISRVLAAKAALATRVDALADHEEVDLAIGLEGRAKVEARLRQLEGGGGITAISQVNKTGSLTSTPIPKYSARAAKAEAAAEAYQEENDVVMSANVARGRAKDDDDDDDDEDEDETPKKRKKKKSKSDDDDDDTPTKKKAKAKTDDDDDDTDDDDTPSKKKKKKKKAKKDDDDDDTPVKKKKKKKSKEEKEEKKKKKRKAEDDDNGEKDSDDDDDDDDEGAKKKKKKKKKKAKKTEE